mgnify:FL=1
MAQPPRLSAVWLNVYKLRDTFNPFLSMFTSLRKWLSHLVSPLSSMFMIASVSPHSMVSSI